MLNLSPIDYLADFHKNQPSLFRESENIHRLVQAIYDVIDVQQRDFLWLAENLLDVEVAEGVHLDFIGNLVGQDRILSDFNTDVNFGFEDSYQSETFGSSLNPDVGGYWRSRSNFNSSMSRRLTDEEYRRVLKARVIYNNSNCKTNDLIEVLNLLTGNTKSSVQSLAHGNITIKAEDPEGLLSYFMSKIDTSENILPVAVGVRVVMSESRRKIP